VDAAEEIPPPVPLREAPRQLWAGWIASGLMLSAAFVTVFGWTWQIVLLAVAAPVVMFGCIYWVFFKSPWRHRLIQPSKGRPLL